MSLPAILGTTLQTIPAEVPYLAADPHSSAAGAMRWTGSMNSRSASSGKATRSIPGIASAPSVSPSSSPSPGVPGVRLFSLQKNFGLDQIEAVSDRFLVTGLGHRLDDFVDTAAVMRNLDLVISADSSPAHLGVPWECPSGCPCPTSATGGG